MKKAKLGLMMSAVLAGGMFASTAYAAGMDRGTMLANTCAGCHGPGGISHGPATPSIAGMSRDYFIESMSAYAMGDRPSTIMTRIAKGYTDEDVEAMATYFAGQKFNSAIQKSQDSDAKKVAKGQKLHAKYCEKCHSEGGSLAEDDSGILAGQWKPYLQYNLYDFTSGDREAPKKMAKKLKKLHDKEGQAGVDALIEYYSSK